MPEVQRGTGGFLNPQKVLAQLEIQAPSRIAHFGCGHGYFTIPMAQMVGSEGHIYAVDILEDALKEVKSKAEAAGLKNIETIRANLEVPSGSKLPEASCDLVLLANILFESQKKSDMLKEARRVLKNGGRLVIIEWLPSVNHSTPQSGWRISQGEAQGLAQAENFSLDRQFEAGDYHYGLIFKKF